MSAPNPWFEESKVLTSDGILLEGEQPLEMIRDFVLNWPGEETVKLDDQTRHDRLMQIIAGYPEIDVGRYPLDWPLSKKAAKGLRLTLYLDSIHSPDKSTSLRSVLINKSFGMKGLAEKEFCAAHRRFLAILLLGLRQANKAVLADDSLTKSEHKLLVSLHSNSQQRIHGFWPLNELSETLDKKWGDPGDGYLPHIRSQNLPGPYCSGWENYDDISNVISGNRIIVKMRSIQRWIKNWSDKHQKWSDGAVFIRGASAILESVMSGLRSVIIREYGVESIIIDGGGRIEFIGDEYAKGRLATAFYNVFTISNNRLPYFNNEIEAVARTLSGKFRTEKVVASDFGLIYGIESDKWEDKEFRKGKMSEWISHHLPKLSITENDEKPEEHHFSEIVNSDCCLCKKNIQLQGNQAKRNGQISNLEYPYCTFHRLLFHIGSAQRMIDSTTKELGSPHSFFNQSQRTVNGVARLDLNSLGILFLSEFIKGHRNSTDLRRRRSIRFNSQWWGIVNDVLDNDDLNIDQIVAWVAAGDDIILADYVPVGNRPTPKIRRILQTLSLKLQKLSIKEYSPFEITFGAGLSTKDIDGNIIQMMNRSKDSEDKAKRIWKQRVESDESRRWMLIDSKGAMKTYKVANVNDEDIFEYNGSLVYSKPS